MHNGKEIGQLPFLAVVSGRMPLLCAVLQILFNRMQTAIYGLMVVGNIIDSLIVPVSHCISFSFLFFDCIPCAGNKTPHNLMNEGVFHKLLYFIILFYLYVNSF